MNPSVAARNIQDSVDVIANSLNAVAAPIYVKDKEHRWLFANPACCQLLDTPLERLVGCVDHDVRAVVDGGLCAFVVRDSRSNNFRD